jgi:hypothetical protein
LVVVVDKTVVDKDSVEGMRRWRGGGDERRAFALRADAGLAILDDLIREDEARGGARGLCDDGEVNSTEDGRIRAEVEAWMLDRTRSML